jgi:hypothetical protein
VILVILTPLFEKKGGAWAKIEVLFSQIPEEKGEKDSHDTVPLQGKKTRPRLCELHCGCFGAFSPYFSWISFPGSRVKVQKSSCIFEKTN